MNNGKPSTNTIALLFALLTSTSSHVGHPASAFSFPSRHPSFVTSASSSRGSRQGCVGVGVGVGVGERRRCTSQSASCRETYLLGSSSDDERASDPAWDLKVGIVGAGPSGLLLAHRLLQSKLPLAKIDIYESRSDPRDLSNASAAGRAYALGLGIRGRSAIRSVDERLWSAVKKRGYECERFRLHLTSKFNVKLRDREEGVEPSVLIYQTDLCGAMLDELDGRSGGGGDAGGGRANVVEVHFDSNIARVDLASSVISIKSDDNEDDTTNNGERGPYDLIVGCDGANSIVRNALQTHSPPNTFSYTQRKLLPGCFKVARAAKMPPLMDPESVGLLLPESKSLGITAFVEPTVEGGACVLFAGKLSNNTDEATTSSSAEGDGDGEEEADNLGSILFPPPDSKEGSGSPLSDMETIKKLITDQFPLLEGTPGMEDMVQQLLSQRTSVADSVKCNIYSSNYDSTATAICGDAAHATGGVSGQGCNSALVDSATLADCLTQHYQTSNISTDTVQSAKRAMLHQVVSSYSQKAVPEGHALYDLSFGNDGKTLPIFRNVKAILSNAVDALFGGKFGIGKKPLQTLLASSSSPFVDIRREREKYYVEDFPSDEDFRGELDKLYDIE